MTVTASQISKAKALGLTNVEPLAAACTKYNLPFYIGCAILHKETGGLNIYGHDKGGAYSVLGKNITVTKSNFADFLKQVNAGKTSNGVGPMQITWKGFFTDMQKKGLKPWVPADNIDYGVSLLSASFHAALDKGKTLNEAILAMGTAYNGATSYGTNAVTVATQYRSKIGENVSGLETVDSSSYGPIFNITMQKGNIVLAAARKAGHEITRVYGYNSAITSDHRFKQCIDFMHYGNTAMREWLEKYLIDNYKKLGIMGLISNRRCMGFPSEETVAADREVVWNGPEGEWRVYSGYDPHTDHVHVQFNTEAVQGTRPKPAPTPAPASGSTTYPFPHSNEVFISKLKSGILGSDSVYYWQMALNAISFKGGSELKLDGDYRAVTANETKLFQKQVCGDKPDGWPGPKQAELAFQKAEKEMKKKGVKHLRIYDSPTTRKLIKKVW